MMIPMWWCHDTPNYIVVEARRRLTEHLLAKGLKEGTGKFSTVMQRHLQKYIAEVSNDPKFKRPQPKRSTGYQRHRGRSAYAR